MDLPDVRPYAATKVLGQGGVGLVLRARAPDGREVAVKVLREASPERQARFEREARLLAGFSLADGFVPLLDQGRSPAGPFLVMPLVPGGTLRERLERGPLPLEEALLLARALAGAIGRAHAQGIVHRDLKPENVLFTAEGAPLIADLGLARHFTDDAPGAHSLGLSRTGELRGTVTYMAPEQAIDARRVGPSADVFSIGAILFECLSGRPAFEGTTLLEVMTQLERGATPLGQAMPGAPAWLCDVVDRALSPRPEDRPADGAALAAALVPTSPRRSRTLPRVLALALLALLATALLPRLRPAPGVVAPPPPPGTGPVVEPPDRPTFPRQVTDFLVSEDGRARLRAVRGDYAWRLPYPARSLVVSPDGAEVLVGTNLWQVMVYDLTTGQDLRLVPAYRGSARSLALTPDGARVLIGGQDGAILLRDADGSRKRTVLRSKGAPVLAVRVERDGSGLAADEQGEVLAWSARATETEQRRAPGGTYHTAAFSSDARSVLLVEKDGSARLARTDTGQTTPLTTSQRRVHAGAFTRDDARVVLACFPGAPATCLLVDVVGEQVAPLVGEGESARAVACSPTQDLVAVAEDAGIRLWDLGTRTVVRVLEEPLVTALAFTSDGRRLISSSEVPALRCWDVATGRLLSGRNEVGVGLSLARTADGSRVVCGHHGGAVRLWDRRSGDVRELVRARHGVSNLAVAPDGSVVFYSHVGEPLAVDSSGAPVPLPPYPTPAHGFAVVDERTLLLSCKPGLALWDVRTGETRLLLPGGIYPRVAASKAEGACVAVAPDGTLRRCSLTGEASSPPTPLPEGAPWSFACTPDLRRVAIGTDLGVAFVHGGDGAAPPRRFAAERAHPLLGLALSVDGRLLAASSIDNSITVWNVDGGERLTSWSLIGAGDVARVLSFGPGGELLVLTQRGVLLEYAVTR